MPLAPKKTAQTILDSGNDYLGALKGNQPGLLAAVETHFQPQHSAQQINKGHGRIEKRTVSMTHCWDGIPDFPGLQTLIRVESERQVQRANIIELSTETRYYVASFSETVQAFANRAIAVPVRNFKLLSHHFVAVNKMVGEQSLLIKK